MAVALKQSPKIAVGKGAAPTAEATDMAEAFVNGLALDAKTSMRMRLLTEEVLEMLKGMVGAFSGLFWLEADDKECRICIDGTAEIDVAAERDLVSVSKGGKNASVKGFTAKLTQFVRHHKEYMQRLSGLMELGGAVYPEDYLYIGPMHPTYEMVDVTWTMNNYKHLLFDDLQDDARAAADRDELEKSILANLADDVQVGVKEDRIKITVIKKL